MIMDATMKTAVTVLQELMVKLGKTPEYECVSQAGPSHQTTFEYRCIACGVGVTATARSKKEAKQEAARLMLQQLAYRGHPIPPPYGLVDPMFVASQPCSSEVGDTADPRSYVALLKELCEEYKLPPAEFELVGDTGPPHLRRFTVRARVGQLERHATATAKKAARQLAAHQLYCYLRENLASLTADFVEEDALMRVRDKAMERYVEADNDAPWRPDLGRKVVDYHLGVVAQTDEASRAAALAALHAEGAEGAEGAEAEGAAERRLSTVAAVLQLRVEAAELETAGGGALAVLQLVPTAPALAFTAATRDEAARAALAHVEAALHLAPPAPPAPPAPTAPPAL